MSVRLKPVPLTEQEIEKMDIEQRKIELNYEVGDSVKIKHGPLENFIGVVDEINLEKKKSKLLYQCLKEKLLLSLNLIRWKLLNNNSVYAGYMACYI